MYINLFADYDRKYETKEMLTEKKEVKKGEEATKKSNQMHWPLNTRYANRSPSNKNTQTFSF